jgi:hypothetical protein
MIAVAAQNVVLSSFSERIPLRTLVMIAILIAGIFVPLFTLW